MKNENTGIIVIMCFVAIWLFCVIVSYKSNHKRGVYHKKYIEEVYGNIQFKGEVLQLHKIRRGGRIYGLMCIKLDYTNTDNFYRFDNKMGGPFSTKDKMSCLKIKDGIITFPTGFIGTDYSIEFISAIINAKYVEVNINNSRQIVYIDSIGNRYSTDLNFPNNLIEEDMQICGGNVSLRFTP